MKEIQHSNQQNLDDRITVFIFCINVLFILLTIYTAFMFRILEKLNFEFVSFSVSGLRF